MNTTIWVFQILLAGFFILPGFGKITKSKQQHIDDGHIQPQSSIIPIRILGILEWLGCIGIIAPQLTGIVTILTPIAALCFCLLMIAAMVIHIQKKEYKMMPLLTVLLILAASVAYYRLFTA